MFTFGLFLHFLGPIPKANEKGKRILKSQGSKKLNRYCTSQIIVDNYKSGKCEVKYHKTHYGHGIDIEHLKIPKSEKDIIASKLIMGVTKEKYVVKFYT